MNQAPVINIFPVNNPDGTYTLNLSPFELSEFVKGLKYMYRQRDGVRKYQKSKTQHLPVINVTLSTITYPPPVYLSLALSVK